MTRGGEAVVALCAPKAFRSSSISRAIEQAYCGQVQGSTSALAPHVMEAIEGAVLST